MDQYPSDSDRVEPEPTVRRFSTLEEFRRAYFPKDQGNNDSAFEPETIGRELARRSAVLVKSAFAAL